MIRVSVTELKNQLSEYLRRVKRGESIEVVERSVPIARIEAIPASAVDDERIGRLQREGVLQAPKRSLDRSILDFVPVPCTGDAVQTLIEQRGDR